MIEEIFQNDLKLLDQCLRESGVKDERLMDMARNTFLKNRMSDRARGLGNPAIHAARRMTQQVIAVAERERETREKQDKQMRA